MTGYLNDAELALMRSTVEQTMADTCSIVRDTYTAGSFSAAGTVTAGTIYADIPCRVRVMPFRPSEIGLPGSGQIIATHSWNVWLHHDVVVQENDRIVYRDRILHVINVNGPITWDMQRKVLCYQTNLGGQ